MSPRSARPETGRLGSRGGVLLSPDLLLPLPRHAQRHPRAPQEKCPRQPLECPTGEGKCERCPSRGRLSVRRPPLRAARVPPGPSEGFRPLPASLTPAITPRFPASDWGGPRALGGGGRGALGRDRPHGPPGYFPLFLCIDCSGRLSLSPCYSLELYIQMLISFFSPLLFASLLFTAICKTAIFLFCISFPWGWS